MLERCLESVRSELAVQETQFAIRLEDVNDKLKVKFEGQRATLGLQVSDIEAQLGLMFQQFSGDINNLH